MPLAWLGTAAFCELLLSSSGSRLLRHRSWLAAAELLPKPRAARWRQRLEMSTAASSAQQHTQDLAADSNGPAPTPEHRDTGPRVAVAQMTAVGNQELNFETVSRLCKVGD